MKRVHSLMLFFCLSNILYSCNRNRVHESVPQENGSIIEEVTVIGVPQTLYSRSEDIEDNVTIIGEPQTLYSENENIEEEAAINEESQIFYSGNDNCLEVLSPDHKKGQFLQRISYCTSYNNKTRNPNWVAWKLTREHTDGPYPRKGVPYFTEDGQAYGIGKVTLKTLKNVYFLDSESEKPRQELSDWSTKYNMSHGHMCPAGDNKWDRAAINQSFLLTNMCPQDQSLNSGGWNKLEEKCRSWANKYGYIYIVAGPIFRGKPSRFLGHIAVPDAFFKVVLCMSGKPKAIGFIYENDSSSQSINNKYCTVDHVEEITGFDFFSSLPDDVEDIIEAKSNINDWK